MLLWSWQAWQWPVNPESQRKHGSSSDVSWILNSCFTFLSAVHLRDLSVEPHPSGLTMAFDLEALLNTGQGNRKRSCPMEVIDLEAAPANLRDLPSLLLA